MNQQQAQYEEVERKTPEQYAGDGYLRLASHLREQGVAERVTVKRPGGWVYWQYDILTNGKQTRKTRLF